MNMKKNKLISLVLGPVLFLAALLLIPDSLFAFSARCAVGLVVWMGCWWITLPVAVGVTALLPILVNAFFDLVPMSTISGKYFSEIVVLLLGADLISLSWEKTGLDKRISLKALCWIGPSLRQQIAVWFVLSAVLSMFLPNAVVCAVMCPIAVSMLKFIGEGDISKSKAGAIILASIAWGAGIGGLGSPLGGAMNLVAVDYFEQLTGTEYMYVDWMIRLVPMLVLLLAVNLVYLFLIKPKTGNLNGTRAYFQGLYRELPPISRDEAVSLALFVTATVLSFVRPLYTNLLPGVKPAYVFLLFGMLTFVLPKKEGGAILSWKDAEKGVLWGLLFLFAGGLAVGQMISDTGAAAAIADVVSRLDLDGGLPTIFIFVAFTVLLAEISSNTAAAAIATPVVVTITQGLGLDPIPYLYITAAAFNCAYVLPTSIRAIPVGYGLSTKYLFRNGLVLTVLGIVVITLAGWAMLTFWPLFSAA